MRRDGDGGFTFIEVMIALAIMAALVIAVYMLLSSSAEHSATMATALTLENECRQVLDDVSKDLRNSTSATQGGTLLTDGNWTISTTLTLTPVDTNIDPAQPGQYRPGHNPFAGAPLLDTSIVWTSAPDAVVDPVDGVDNNNDGLTDETQITRTQGTEVLRLSGRGTSRWPAASAPTGGTAATAPQWPVTASPPAVFFAVHDSDGAGILPPDPFVTVTVTLQGIDSRGRPMTRSLTARIGMRNN